MKLRYIKYLIPFIFLTLGLKGILCFESNQKIEYSRILKIKLPTRSTNSDSPNVIDDFVASNHFNSEENDSEEDDDIFLIWFTKTSKDDRLLHINHFSAKYLIHHEFILNYLPKIYLKIRVLLL